jgi:hypothetical protein
MKQIDRVDGKSVRLLVSPRGDTTDIYADLDNCLPIRVGKYPDKYRAGPLAPQHLHVWEDDIYIGYDWCNLCGLLSSRDAGNPGTRATPGQGQPTGGQQGGGD